MNPVGEEPGPLLGEKLAEARRKTHCHEKSREEARIEERSLVTFHAPETLAGTPEVGNQYVPGENPHSHSDGLVDHGDTQRVSQRAADREHIRGSTPTQLECRDRYEIRNTDDGQSRLDKKALGPFRLNDMDNRNRR